LSSINLKTEKKIKAAVSEHVNSLKSQFPPLEEYLKGGCSLDFRVAGNALHCDIHISGAVAEQVKSLPLYGVVDLVGKDYGGKYDLTINSGFDPVKVLDGSFESLLNSALQFKVQGNGENTNIHNLISYVKGVVSTVSQSGKAKKIASALSILSIFRTVGLEFHYSVEDAKHLVEEIVGHQIGGEEAKGMLQGYQGMANEFLPQAQAMAGFLLGPYVEELKAVNLGNFEAHVYVPKFRAYVNFALVIPSLNGFINEKFLQ